MTDIRPATAEDAAAVADLYRRSFLDTFGHLYSEADLAKFLSGKSASDFARQIADPAYRLALAEAGGRAVGFVKLGPPTLPVATPANTIELHQLYLDPAAKGSGAAARLMDWALAEARSRGAAIVQLSVYADNHRARRFYDRYGFVEEDRFDFMVGDHADDERVMRVRL